MELPTDLWSNILQKTTCIDTCNNLYNALPNNIKIELKNIYDLHSKSLKLKIIIGFHNKLSFYNGLCLKKELLFINIMAIRNVKNWNTPIGKKDCLVIILKSGIILFLDTDTLDYINMIELDHAIIEIEFHPKKSIMLTVDNEFWGSIMKIYKFNEDGSIDTNSIDTPEYRKKIYFFHPFTSEIFIFLAKYLYNPFHRKLFKLYIYNYDTNSILFFDQINSFLDFNNYYMPINIDEEGSFECYKYQNGNCFCKFIISNFEIKEIKTQIICQNIGIEAKLVIWNFLRINSDIYFYTNRIGDACIYKQTGNDYKIIYKTSNNILRFFIKNGYIIFIEQTELKFINLKTLLIEELKIGELVIDFCVL
jgi:hypothetical protein